MQIGNGPGPLEQLVVVVLGFAAGDDERASYPTIRDRC